MKEILADNEIRDMVDDHLERFQPSSGTDLLKEIMCAIVSVESGGNPWAVRYEPGYKWLFEKPVKPVSCALSTEWILQRMSWGLCQIMGATARDHGFAGWLTELLDPAVNLYWGLKHLHWIGEKWVWDQGDMVSAWNQGSPRRAEDGKYRNQAYVDKVLTATNRLRDVGILGDVG